MIVLVTGGAGFIGRWVVKKLLQNKCKVFVIDDLSNSGDTNLNEFRDYYNFKELIIHDIKDKKFIDFLFLKYDFDVVFHLAAQINVQESLDHPEKTFENNVIGTYNILEASRKYRTRVILVSTCMVYDLASFDVAISEDHKVKPTSPYAASKLMSEQLALSYYYSFDLPVVILRLFNVYGSFQKTNMEGGVISIFIKCKLDNKNVLVFGDGSQTRDFLYVEDCAEFIVKASKCEECIGEIINAGTGNDISINDLAKLIIEDEDRIKYVSHHHPQSEIMKLVCNNFKAKKLLNWEPKTNLIDGILILEKWLNSE